MAPYGPEQDKMGFTTHTTASKVVFGSQKGALMSAPGQPPMKHLVATATALPSFGSQTREISEPAQLACVGKVRRREKSKVVRS